MTFKIHQIIFSMTCVFLLALMACQKEGEQLAQPLDNASKNVEGSFAETMFKGDYIGAESADGFNFTRMTQMPYDEKVQGGKGRQLVLRYSFARPDRRNIYSSRGNEFTDAAKDYNILSEDPDLKSHFPLFKSEVEKVFAQISSLVPICFVEANDTFNEHADFHFFAYKGDYFPVAWGFSEGLRLNTYYQYGILSKVLGHELLHVLGLGHSNEGTSKSIMAAGSLSNTLLSDDIEGIQQLYGQGSCKNPESKERMRAEVLEAGSTSVIISWSPLFFFNGRIVQNFAKNYEVSLFSSDNQLVEKKIVKHVKDLTVKFSGLENDTEYKVKIKGKVENIVFPSRLNLDITDYNQPKVDFREPGVNKIYETVLPLAMYILPESVESTNSLTAAEKTKSPGVEITWTPEPDLRLEIWRWDPGAEYPKLIKTLASTEAKYVDTFKPDSGFSEYAMYVVAGSFSGQTPTLTFKTAKSDTEEFQVESSSLRKHFKMNYTQLSLNAERPTVAFAVNLNDEKSQIVAWTENAQGHRTEQSVLFETNETIVNYINFKREEIYYTVATTTNGNRCQIVVLDTSELDQAAILGSMKRTGKCTAPQFAYGFDGTPEIIWAEVGKNPGIYSINFWNFFLTTTADKELTATLFQEGVFYAARFVASKGHLAVVGSKDDNGQYWLNLYQYYLMDRDYYIYQYFTTGVLASNAGSPYFVAFPEGELSETPDMYWVSNHAQRSRVTWYHAVEKRTATGNILPVIYTELIEDLPNGEIVPLGNGKVMSFDGVGLTIVDKLKETKKTYDVSGLVGQILHVRQTANVTRLLVKEGPDYKACKITTTVSCDPKLSHKFLSLPVLTENNGEAKLIGVVERDDKKAEFVSLGVN